MKQPTQPPRIFGFGVFELDLNSGDLRRNGVKVPLQEQPSRLLGLLLEHSGELLSREGIAKQLWPDDSYGNLDHRVNNAVNKIRIALGDSAENPRFLETIPRRGYRFTAPVHEVGRVAEEISTPPRRHRPRIIKGAAAIFVLAAAFGSGLWLYSRTPPEPASDKILLAVLPFKTIGNALDKDYLSDGLTVELILQLGRLSSSKLGIIARTSVMPYKTTEKGIRRIGEELQVDYIVEGSVRQEVDQLRITTQLIRVDDQTQLWAESYNRTLQDVFSVQMDVAERVSASLALEFLPPSKNQPSPPSTNRVAHTAYLKARYFRDLATEEGYFRAIEYFGEAVTEDPLYARAYAGLASCQCLVAGHGLEVFAPDQTMPRARELAYKALELDADLAEAHAVLGMVRLKYEWNFEGAEESFLRALELNPSYSQGHFWYSLYLEAMGRRQDAVHHAMRARELNPISKGAAANLAMQLANAGRFGEATAEIAEALELDGSFWGAHWVLGQLHTKQGNHAEATLAFHDAVDLSARNSVSLASLGFTYARAGNRSEAEAILKELLDIGKERYLSPAFVAAIYAGLGQKDESFSWLEQAFDARSRYLVWLNVAPEYEQLRTDPRYQELVTRIGLP